VPVELVVKRETGGVPHMFVLKLSASGIMIDESLSTDEKSIIFTPTAVGKYTLYCCNWLCFKSMGAEKDWRATPSLCFSMIFPMLKLLSRWKPWLKVIPKHHTGIP
jgi:hypothetical protein